MNKLPDIITGDHYEPIPILDLIKQAREYPNAYLWRLKHGGTFETVIFANNEQAAKKRLKSIFRRGPIEVELYLP